jgi:hypothetical protein
MSFVPGCQKNGINSVPEFEQGLIYVKSNISG